MRGIYPNVPITVIINPQSGPGDAFQESYLQGIITLQRAGIRVLGYVAMGYMDLSDEYITIMKNRWFSWYPMINGLFLDEFPSVLSLNLLQRCNSLFFGGKTDGRIMAINPGTALEIAPSIKRIPFHMIVSWENRTYPDIQITLRQIEMISHLEERPDLGCLVLEQPVRRRIIKQTVFPLYDWYFVTPYTVGQNPWGMLERGKLRLLLKLQQLSH